MCNNEICIVQRTGSTDFSVTLFVILLMSEQQAVSFQTVDLRM